VLGPIFTVDLVTSARRPRYFLLRVIYGLVLLSFLWICYFQAFHSGWRNLTAVQQAAEFAGQFFVAFSVIQLVTVLLVGPAMSAATIASEREYRTIEYLFATDLTNSEIILSKLVARLLHIGSLIVVGLPVLAIAMLMGGIDPEGLVMMFVITLSTMVAVAALGMAISVSSPRVRDALGRIYVILFALVLLPSVVIGPCLSAIGLTANTGNFHYLLGAAQDANQLFLDANPLAIFFKAVVRPAFLRGVWQARWEPVLWMTLYQSVFSALLVAYSLWGVRRVHLASAGKTPGKGKFRFRLWPRPGIGNFPMIWKESLAGESGGNLGLLGRIAATLIVLSILLPTIWMFAFIDDKDQFRGMSVGMSTLLACGGLLVVGARAASSITGERERDTWITLLSTPIESNEIISSKIVGSIWANRAVTIVLAMIWLMQILRDPLAIVSVVLTIGSLAIALTFVSALGTFYSLSLRTTARAIGATLGTLLALSGGYLMCCMPMMIGDGGELMLAPCIPFLLAFAGMTIRESPSHEPPELILAYVFGNLGYLIAAVVLWTTTIARLERGGSRDGAYLGPAQHKSGDEVLSGEDVIVVEEPVVE